MASGKGRVLLVDDEDDYRQAVSDFLAGKGFAVVSCRSADEALLQLGEQDFDVVVTDLQLPGMSGVQLCERIVSSRPDIPVVVLTAFGSLDTAVAAIRAGAYDFLAKPFELEQLALSLQRSVGHHLLQREVKRLRAAAAEVGPFQELFGSSAAMQTLFDLMRRIADSDSSILVVGESGTGKELVAQALHGRSARGSGPFVAVNCAAMPETLLESELFGHAKGAFTDARSERSGLLLSADGGTLFLDEIGDMPLGLQPKLLRVLQERKVRRVGEDSERPFDVRVISATNKDLEVEVEEGRFREDLYFRLNVIQLEVPPLRSRGRDILVLAEHFLGVFAARAGKAIAGISPAAAVKLMGYSWPGNVRELQNSMERAVALARYEEVVVEDLPEKVASYLASHVLLASDDPSELVPMAEVEKRYIVRVLQAVGGNKSQAARILGFDRKTLYRKLSLHGVEDEEKD